MSEWEVAFAFVTEPMWETIAAMREFEAVWEARLQTERMRVPKEEIPFRLRDWNSAPWCLGGWSGCDGNYTGGHYCRKDFQHSGRCVCADCGATTTKNPPMRVPKEEKR